MGQYYRTFLGNGFQTHVIDPFDYGSLCKLMEHSWVGNKFCNAVVATIKEMYTSNQHAVKMVHVGDYARDKPAEVDKRIYNRTWGDGTCGYGILKTKIDYPPNNGECFVLNCDKNEYIRYRFNTNNEDDMHINHLMLLTAAGNGRGGGDYHGRNMDMVGSWAGDRLIVLDEEPSKETFGESVKIHGWVFKEDR